MDLNARIFVAGHRGLVGSAIVRALDRAGYRQILTATRSELDLRESAAVDGYFATIKPQFVFVAAAKVGGILANDSKPAEFIYDNLMIEANIINAAYRSGVEKLLFLGSTCIYPKNAPQPLREEYLLSGPLEETNEWYAIAKIAGIKLCQAYRKQYGCSFISVMPTNLYGPGDNFGLETSHVVPALIRRFHEAKLVDAPSVALWGTGTPRREFLFADDCADACVFVMRHYDDPQFLNVGVGEDIAIRDLAKLIADIVGYRGDITYDTSKPDGTPRKLVDVSRLLALGWRAATPLDAGLRKTYAWYIDHERSDDVRL